ncbi:LPO_1073/Vpar_1526 family protein [Marinobacterium arenosum]|uniref:LPO_1073/Vpar_1526 family protein n=1 Tax=Marinobacterium arenosum TaxID=2862496 RepID=UPI001C94F5E9|nr:LPO_1073/Vpar_1526 family protein [Marinobacterium arenosum]MBY4675907.1 hypothetical protein [Marinobacterium arenosum]
MINDKNQKQQGGDCSTNLQGQSIVINQGISYSDAKEIALDVYKSNFLQLSQDAAAIAIGRAEELTDSFLSKLKEENEEAISQMNQPGMQAALYEAQKQYAKTGDKDLENLLVDILVERASTPERNIHQIVLDEALQVSAKLTTEQMNTLTINFLITQTTKQGLLEPDDLVKYLEQVILPFTKDIKNSDSCYQHLAYTGCIGLMDTSFYKPLEQILLDQYTAFLCKGFTLQEFEDIFEDTDPALDLIMKCFIFEDKYQFRAIDSIAFKKMMEGKNIDPKSEKKLLKLYESSKMESEEAKKYILSKSEKLEHLFKEWKDTNLSKFRLTTVGIAIAQANFRKSTGVKLTLGTWIT